jgi:hypothetical protein
MSVLAPPDPPRSDELEALIREARARQLRRRLGVVALVALVAGGALAIYAIVAAGNPAVSRPNGQAAGADAGEACGVRGVGVRILDRSGQTVYREPGHYVHPNAGFPTIRCSGSTVWAVWDNGAGMSQEAYVGARSVDRGRTWRLVFSEGMFGPKAPHQLDSYMGPWILRGHVAYFTGSCPACSTKTSVGTVSLWVTKDAGRTFRMYKVPALTGFAPVRLRVVGHRVTIAAKRFMRGVKPHKTVTVHVA